MPRTSDELRSSRHRTRAQEHSRTSTGRVAHNGASGASCVRRSGIVRIRREHQRPASYAPTSPAEVAAVDHPLLARRSPRNIRPPKVLVREPEQREACEGSFDHEPTALKLVTAVRTSRIIVHGADHTRLGIGGQDTRCAANTACRLPMRPPGSQGGHQFAQYESSLTQSEGAQNARSRTHSDRQPLASAERRLCAIGGCTHSRSHRCLRDWGPS